MPPRTLLSLALIAAALSACLPSRTRADQDAKLQALEGRLEMLEAEVAGMPRTVPADPEARLVKLEQQADAAASARSAIQLQLKALIDGSGTGAQLVVRQNPKWSFGLDENMRWVTIDGCKATLELQRPSALILCANGQATCVHQDGAGQQDNPHPDKWLTLSFFVGNKNVAGLSGLRLFQEPDLRWWQLHTHPLANWHGLATTQLVMLPAGTHEISLRAMQHSSAGRWQLSGLAMGVLVIPR